MRHSIVPESYRREKGIGNSKFQNTRRNTILPVPQQNMPNLGVSGKPTPQKVTESGVYGIQLFKPLRHITIPKINLRKIGQKL